jgi:hypothetical protein
MLVPRYCYHTGPELSASDTVLPHRGLNVMHPCFRFWCLMARCCSERVDVLPMMMGQPGQRSGVER